MMRSPCCDAAVRVACCHEHAKDRDGVTHWYACTACGKPCDPVERKEEGK
jgi:hypothetical protein